jgi:hypothetical protein
MGWEPPRPLKNAPGTLQRDIEGFLSVSGPKILAAHGRDALDAEAKPQVCRPRRFGAALDEQRIGVWGFSYAGGHALVLGATDRRIKAVYAQAPTVSG